MGAARPDFEDLFHDQFNQLVRLLTAMTGDHEDARDCVQEAFIVASRRWRRIQHYDQPAAWVLRVAINRSRDIHRSEIRRRRREQRTPHVPSHGSVDDHSRQAEDRQELDQLLATLTPRQRSVTQLTYVNDLSVDEVADSLGISSGAVKFHLSRARASLRSTIEAGLVPGLPGPAHGLTA